MVRMSVTVRVKSVHHRPESLHELVLRGAFADVTVRLPLAISSAALVMSFIAPISVFRLFLIRLKSPWYVSVICGGNVSLADAVHVIRGDIQGSNDGVQYAFTPRTISA